MKQILPFLFFFCGIVAMGQVHIVPADTTVCYRDSIAFSPVFSVVGAPKITYQWQRNFQDITGSGGSDSVYAISHVNAGDTGFYCCKVFVEGIGNLTSDTAVLRMHPRMFIDTLYRYNALGCPTVDTSMKPLCKGQFKALVSGGLAPYHYYWPGGASQDTIVYGLCPGQHNFFVTDSNQCTIDSMYFVDVLKLPKVDFTFSPHDTIYLTNPTVHVAYPDSMKQYLTNWTWDFGDKVKIPNANPAGHTYSDTIGKLKEIAVKLVFTDLNGCDTVIKHMLTIKTAELDIPNVFTPNGDGVNDQFAIELKDDRKKDYREAYLETELTVFDRWGRRVFSKKDYKSKDWDGDRLSDGTYFYILACKGQYRDDVFKGSATILRGE
jgi:gliding motility-associated-like protein